MALRNRTALTNIVNQENTKNVKSTINGLATRRAALGEIGNKVNTVRGTDGTNKQNLLLKGHKKLVTKPSALKSTTEKAVEKPPVQVVKPVVKKCATIEAIEQPAEVAREKPPVQIIKPIVKNESSEYREELVEEKTDAFSSDLLGIEDIDQADKGNPNLVSIYSNDIYAYLRTLEKTFPIPKGFLAGQEITPKMRYVLVDWLVEVHQQFHLLAETLYLTVAILDRFLAIYKQITKKRLQLVGVTAMFIASKYEEMFSPEISDFVYITDNAYSKMEILQMEMVIAKTLDFSFGRPLPLHFLRRYSKAGKASALHHTMAKYFLEQSLVHYELCHYPPSLIAAAAIYLAFFIVGADSGAEEGQVIWTNTLVHYSKYKQGDLLPLVHKIADAVVNAEKTKYQAVRKKYTNTKYMKISLRPELKSPTMASLANKVEKE